MKNYLQLIRVEQYIKNLFVFAPLFFSGAFIDPQKIITVTFSFICFCITASGIYILNDYLDVAEDKMHPEKSKRPIATGKITAKNALVLMCCFILISLLSSYVISPELFKIILLYIILNILYSKWLKHIAILDLNIIAIGFVLRLYAGAIVVNVVPSIWILLITYLLALFLAIAKRRTDVVLAQNGQQVRKNIEGYNLVFIDITLGILSSVIIVCYIFYCIAPENQLHYKSKLLYISIILIMNGIFRYLKLSLVDQSTYSPTKIILKDTFLQITVLSWALLMGYLLYFNQ
jgi:4-hydroxybenzoate polyprenyltransferase